MSLLRLAALISVGALICAGQAQTSSGDLTGTVTDLSGAVVARASVTATNPETGLARETQTDLFGDYRISLLPPGVYRLRVEAAGFAITIVEQVPVRVGDTVVMPVQLSVSGVASEVTVHAEPPVVDVQRTQQASTIQSTEIRNLPINRRSYLDFALLTPGVVETTSMVDGTDYRVVQAPQSGLSFGGSNGRGNAFTVDGLENYINSGGVRPSVSQEAVAEFQVNRNGFSAESGSAFGGAVNIITRSGSNNWRGNVFGFLRNRAVQARNYFDPVTDGSAYTRSQAGATLGGPLRRDKTFVFAAFERLDRHETTFIPILEDKSAFGRLTTGQQQLVDFFNASGQPLLQGLARQVSAALTTSNYPSTVKLFNANSGTFPFGENNNQFLAKFDQRFSNTHSAFLRLNVSSGQSENALSGALLAYNRGRNIGQKDYTAVISDTLLLSPGWIAETRGQFALYELDITTIDKNGPSIDITGYGLFGRDIFLPAKIVERHYQMAEVLSYNSGKHDMRFGGDYNPVRDNVRTETFFSGRFSFGEVVPLGQLLNSAAGDPNFTTGLAQLMTAMGQARLVPNLSQPITSLQAYNLGYPSYYQQGFGEPNWIGTTHRINLFLQDTWRVHRNFTLNLGLRYELEKNPKVIRTDPNNIAPRAGFAWDITGNNKTVVRGSAGMFYSANNLQISNVADTLSGIYIQQVFVPLSATPGLNNALTGRPLTSADIWQTLFAQGVIGNRAITRQDLAQFGLIPSPNLPFAVVFGIVDDWKNPYSEQASLEVERSVAGFSVSAAYNWNRGLHLPRILDRNLLYGPRRADGQPTFTFVNPLLFQRNIFEPSANSFYSAGVFQVSRRFGAHWSMNAHYTLARAIDETTDFNTDFQPHDQLNPRAERALSAFHQKHRFVFNSVLESPMKNVALRNWMFSPIFIANSGRPFNVLAGVDNMGDRRVTTHRPSRAGRNIGMGPKYASFDARLSRKFGLRREGRSVEFIAEGFNLLNHTNFRSVNNVVGNITVEDLPKDIVGTRAPTSVPLAFTSAFDARQFQFGLKINF